MPLVLVRIRAGVAVAVLLCLPAVACGDWVESDKLLPSGGTAGDLFGWSADLEGDRAVVGNVRYYLPPAAIGAAWTFVHSNGEWQEEAKLESWGDPVNDNFGWAVGLSGDTIAVGAPSANGAASSSGAVYVYLWEAGAWTAQAKLFAADGTSVNTFGFDVALEGDTLVAGAPHSWDGGVQTGAAHVFVREAGVWTEQAKLLATGGGEDDRFGYAVALSGDTALVGATLEDDGLTDAGAAYVFERQDATWTQTARLVPSDPAASQGFGNDVRLVGDVALIGAARDSTLGENSGAMYVFRRTGGAWTQEAKLLAGDGEAGDRFGASVELSPDRAFATAPQDDDQGENAGAAYVFEFNGTSWLQIEKLTASDGAAADGLGKSIAVSDGRLLIGAMNDSDQGQSSGSSYLFEQTCPGDLNGDGQRDQADLGILLASYEVDAGGDIDGDGDTDQADLGTLLASYGVVCP
jgi:FG-GAP repeat